MPKGVRNNIICVRLKKQYPFKLFTQNGVRNNICVMRDTDKPVPLETVHAERFSEQQYMYTLYRQTSFFKPFTQKGVRNSIIHTLYWQTSNPWNCSCRNCVFATACILLRNKSMLFRTVGTEKSVYHTFDQIIFLANCSHRKGLTVTCTLYLPNNK